MPSPACQVARVQINLHWAQRSLAFHALKDLLQVGPGSAQQFLEYLALERDVSAGTQNQALNALVSLYRQVLGQGLAMSEDVLRAKRTKRLPVVLSREEALAILDRMEGHHRLMARLLSTSAEAGRTWRGHGSEASLMEQQGRSLA